jgi:hypothetical protein
MADITINDSSSLSVAASVLDDSIIGKTPGSVIHFLQSDVIAVLSQPLDKVQINSASMGFNFKPSFQLPGGTAVLKAGGAIGGEIDLYRPGKDGKPARLFDADRFGVAIDTGSNCYLALSFPLSLNAETTPKSGAYTLELEGSAETSAKLFYPFAAAGGSFPTLKEALEQLFGAYSLPSSLAQAATLKTGAGVVFESRGTIQFEGKVDLLATINPTATPGLCTTGGPISIKAGPSITAGGKFSFSGDFQVRIWKKSESIIQLGYYKKRGSSISISFAAGAGADADLGGFDILSQLYGLLGDACKLDPAWLKANVPHEVADNVEDAYQAALQTTAQIALNAALDVSTKDEAAFVWNFDMTAMDADAHTAFARAIEADLTALMDSAKLPHGVTKAGSVVDHLTETKHTLQLNFLGLLDHANVQDSLADFKVKASEDGQLVLTDTEHLKRLEATITPFVKSDQLRQVFAEDSVATVGYAASLGPLTPQLKVTFSFYEYKDNLSADGLKEYLQIATGLDVPQAASDWTAALQGPFSDRPGSCFASLLYDPLTAQSLFLEKNSAPRIDFESIGRAAAIRTPGLIGDDRFQALLADDADWKTMCEAGSVTRFYEVIGVDSTSPPAWATAGYTILQHIQIWAADMRAAASALQSVMAYLEANRTGGVLNDPQFLHRRQTFANALRQAISKTPLFHDAQGLMTLYVAARPAGKKIAIRYGGALKEYA